MLVSTETKALIEKLEKDLKLSDANSNLEDKLESSVKHLPAYIKILKSHIGQLKNVLQLDNHNRRTLENVNLAKPVRQLIEIFSKLADEDILIIEELYNLARNWQSESSEISVASNEEVSAKETQEMS
jgi:hypothetical protein